MWLPAQPCYSDSSWPLFSHFCRASKFAAEGDAGNGSNYGQQYTNLDGLINLVNTSLIGKLAPKKEKSTLATPTRIRWVVLNQPMP